MSGQAPVTRLTATEIGQRLTLLLEGERQSAVGRRLHGKQGERSSNHQDQAEYEAHAPGGVALDEASRAQRPGNPPGLDRPEGQERIVFSW